ncbi:MAG: 7-carboxy-7-deazaguanine synthase QueE [Prolixibacteraceae bacterium]|jgi:7-carboxy-7-deazaguanine synthase
MDNEFNFVQAYDPGDLLVCEKFVSIQGEGRDSGAHALFIRLAGCNLKCEWCDTKHSWNGGTKQTQKEIITNIQEYRQKYKNNYIVWTGGEPLLQELKLYSIQDKTRDFYHMLETNGTIIPEKPHLFNQIAVSPKPGQKFDGKRWVTIRNAYVKLVVDDIQEAVEFQQKYDFPSQWFFVMSKTEYPFNLEQTHKKEMQIAQECIEHGFNMSPRLQLYFEVK